MRPLSDDIVEFIRQNFSAQDVPTVLKLLDRHDLTTPRVQRALLYLSGGSLSMLQHYVASAALDVREILLRAEYVMNVSSKPMRVRSMALPFNTTQEEEPPASRHRRGARPVPKRTERHPPGLRDQDASAAGHRHLIGMRFELGSAEYVVATEQANRSSVRCYRKSGNVVTIVHLPFVFVMEQLSEHIDLGAIQ